MFDYISKQNVYIQTCFGTLFTWGMTAIGAAMIFLLPLKAQKTKNLLDSSLGFAAGVMIAASYWSLLSPALDKSEKARLVKLNETEVENLNLFDKTMIVVPVAVGFALGAAFVALAGTYLNTDINSITPQKSSKNPKTKNDNISTNSTGNYQIDFLRQRKPTKRLENLEEKENLKIGSETSSEEQFLTKESWQRMLALIIAITVHNIPEGMAVGVGFGNDNFNNACNLAIGIGIQNFPEGLAVSLPLAASGYPKFKAFLWGQFSGLVEPVFGLLGVVMVGFFNSLLPYALGFAAGAMIYVVMDDIVPDACSRENAPLASKWSIVGFIIMMSLDVILG